MKRLSVLAAVAVLCLLLAATFSPPEARFDPFYYSIGAQVEYEGIDWLVWHHSTGKHKKDGKIYHYYLLADERGNNPKWVWVGFVNPQLYMLRDGEGEPPAGGCPDPPGYPCALHKQDEEKQAYLYRVDLPGERTAWAKIRY